jgi:hypothetical protein
MLTKTLLVAAFVAGSASLAAAVPFDPTLINHDPAPVVDVAWRILQAAPADSDDERAADNNDDSMIMKGRVPGNIGGVIFGDDTDAALGGP